MGRGEGGGQNRDRQADDVSEGVRKVRRGVRPRVMFGIRGVGSRTVRVRVRVVDGSVGEGGGCVATTTNCSKSLS